MKGQFYLLRKLLHQKLLAWVNETVLYEKLGLELE